MAAEYKIESDIVFTSHNVKSQVDNIISQLARIPKQVSVNINTGGNTTGGASATQSAYKTAKQNAKLAHQQAIHDQEILDIAKQNSAKAQTALNKNNAQEASRAALANIRQIKAQSAAQAAAHSANMKALLQQARLRAAIAKADAATTQAQIQNNNLRKQVANQAPKLSKTQISPSGGYSKAKLELKEYRASINDATTELQKLGFQAALTAKRFLAFVGVSALFIGVTNSIRSAVTTSIEYEKQFARISQVTGTSIKNLGELDREITRLATSLGVSSASITQVAVTLAQAGLSASETKKALDVLAKTELAATFGDIKNTTEGAIAIMAQFKTGAAELSAQLGSVNSISAKFAVESEDLVEVIRKAGGAFQATGGDLNELLALFTSVRATTRESAESISTGLRTIFTRLQRNRTVNFLSELNIDLRDAKGEFIGIYPAIEKLSTALKDLSGTDPRFNQIVEELGGFRQVSKVIPLLKQFETSQKALSVARRASTSIDKDAVIAQYTLANQLVKVREEFFALSRAYYNDGGLRSFIGYTLQAASALIKVVDAIRPLVPLLGTLGTIKAFAAISGLARGAVLQHRTLPIPIGKATGGVVPGTGNGDTVPANLTPGEFVIRKSAVKAFGVNNLQKINKFATGGQVRKIFSNEIKDAVRGNSQHNKLLQNIFNNQNVMNHIPKGAKHIATGSEALVLETPDQRIIRLGLHGKVYKGVYGVPNLGRSRHPMMLQPLFSRKFGNIQYELLPKADTKHNIPTNVFKAGVEANGLIPNDIGHQNIGRYSGKGIAIDPGTFFDQGQMKRIKRGRYAFGGIVGRAKNYISSSYQQSQADGLGNLFPSDVNRYKGLTKTQALKKWFVGDGPSFIKQVKSLVVGARTPNGSGGVRRSRFLAFQDSLGISRRNPLHGSGSYNPTNYEKFNNLFNSSKAPRITQTSPVSPTSQVAQVPSLRTRIGNSLGVLGNKIRYTSGRVGDFGGVVSGKVGDFLENFKGANIAEAFKRSRENLKLPKLPQLPKLPKLPNLGRYTSNITNNVARTLGKIPSAISKIIPRLQAPKFERTRNLATSIKNAVSDKLFGVVNQRNINQIIKDIEKEQGIKFDEKTFPKIFTHNGNIKDRPVATAKQRRHKKEAEEAHGVYTFRNNGIEAPRIDLHEAIGSKKQLRGVIAHELGHHYDHAKSGYQSMHTKRVFEGGKFYDNGKRYANAQDFEHLVKTTPLSQLSPYHKFAALELEVTKKALQQGRMTQEFYNYRARPEELFAEAYRKYIGKNIGSTNDVSNRFQGNRQEFYDTIIKPSDAHSVVNPKRFAAGGFVGGSGNSDTVPSLLTPGEVVINKKSAKAFGYGRLNKINKYAAGGIVNPGTIGLGLAFGPSVLGSIAGNKNEFANSLISGATAAGGALLIFTLAMKKGTDEFSHNIALASDKLKAVETDLANNQKEFQAKRASREEVHKRDSTILAQKVHAGTDTTTGTKRLTQEAREADKELTLREEKYRADRKVEFAKYTELNAGNLEAKKTLEAEILKEEATKKSAEALNSFTEKTAIVSAALIGFGSILQYQTDILIRSGNRKGNIGLGTSREAGLAGAAIGAGTGALAGSYAGGVLGTIVGGPAGTLIGSRIGAGIGTLAGGLYQGTKSYSAAEQGLQAFDINESAGKLTQTLENISKGRSTVQGARFSVGQSLKEANANFLKLTGEEFETFRGHMNNSIEGLDFIFQESLKAATSIEKFSKENEDLITVLSRFGGYTIPELTKKIKDEIEAKNKGIKIQDGYNSALDESRRRLEATFAISTALSTTESSIHQFGNSLDVLSQLINNNLSDKSNFDFSTLGNVANANAGDLNRQANQAAGFIGGPASGIAADIVEANQITAKLPTLLNDLVLANQLEGDDLLDALKKQLGDKSFASGLILEAVKGQIGATGDTVKFLEKFRQDPTGITRNIQNSVQPTADALAEAMPRIIKQMDEFADGLAAARQTFISSLNNLAKVIDIGQVGAEFNAASSGVPIGFAAERGFDRQRQNLITGGSNITQLGDRLRIAQGQYSANSALRQTETDPQKVKKLTEVISENIKEITLSTNALEYLADVNSRLATVEKERSRLQRDRTAKSSLAEGFAFGDAGAKQETLKGLIGVKNILQNIQGGGLALGGLNDELKQLSLGVLKQFADSPVFNGQTGQQIIDIITKGQGFNVGVNKEEEAIIAQGNIIIAEAKAAQELLNNVTEENNNKFLEGLGQKFDDFFSRLEKNFTEDKKKKEVERQDNTLAQIRGIDKQVNTIQNVKNNLGVNQNTPLDVIKNNLDTGIEIGSIRKTVQDLQKKIASTNALANAPSNTKNIIDTTDIKKYVSGEKGNVLEKEINNIVTREKRPFATYKEQITSKNQVISEIIEKALSEEISKQVVKSQELIKQLGVGNDVKEGFIQGAEEAKKILEKAEIIKDIPKLLEERRKLSGEAPTNPGKNRFDAIGLASGGAVGTDTVPAMTTDGRPYMLTPGEIVMNKRASGKFGNILHKMNTGYLADGGSVSLDDSGRDYWENLTMSSDKSKLRKRDEERRKRLQDIIAKRLAREYKEGELNRKRNASDKYISRGFKSEGSLYQQSTTHVPNATGYSFSQTSKDIGRSFENRRQDERRKDEGRQAYHEKVERFRAAGVPNRDIRQAIANETKQNYFNKKNGVNPVQVGQNPQQTQNQPPAVNPKVMEEFKNTIDKLAGAKLELQINGTLNVNINASNIEDSISKKFFPPIQEYVDNEINKAISKFASANGIPHVVTPGKKGTK